MPPVPRDVVTAVADDLFPEDPSEDGQMGSHAINTGKRRYHFPTAEKYDLQIGQVRALGLLLKAAKVGGYMSRQRIKTELGISPLSGTLQTWFDGIGEGTKRGRARKGLFAHGFVVEESLDVDGVKEVGLTLTPMGMQVAMELERERGDNPLPPLRGADRSTNKRYLTD